MLDIKIFVVKCVSHITLQPKRGAKPVVHVVIYKATAEILRYCVINVVREDPSFAGDQTWNDVAVL